MSFFFTPIHKWSYYDPYSAFGCSFPLTSRDLAILFPMRVAPPMRLLVITPPGWHETCLEIQESRTKLLLVGGWTTHLKNISQIGSLPQVGVNINNIWNHHLGNFELNVYICQDYWHPGKYRTSQKHAEMMMILLMAEILHQLIGSLSHYL